MPKINNNQKGFTMIELLVVIFIIAFVATTFVVGYTRANGRTKITMAAFKLASDIRMAQNYALGMKEKGGGFYKWGVDVGAVGDTKYYIFSDSNNNKVRDVGEEEQTINFPSGISIGDTQMTSVIYDPPDPTIHIFPDLPEAVITLRDINGSTKKVRVNKYGLVEVFD